MSKDCACPQCVGACKNQPGWLAPGEAEKIAEFLEMPFDDFKEQFLVIDSASNWDVSDAPWVYAPRKVGVDDEGCAKRSLHHQRRPATCVFLLKDRCSIHPVKPYECRNTMACDFHHGNRDTIERLYIEAGAPLGMRS